MNNFYEKYRGIINLIIICVVIVFVKTFILSNNKSTNISQDIKNDLASTIDQQIQMYEDADNLNLNPEKYNFEPNSQIKEPTNQNEKDFIILIQALKNYQKEDAYHAKKYQDNQYNLDDALTNEVITNNALIEESIQKVKHNINESKIYRHQYNNSHTNFLNNLKPKVSQKTYERFEKGATTSKLKNLAYFDDLLDYYSIVIKILNLAKEINTLGLIQIEGDNFYIDDDSYMTQYNDLIDVHNAALLKIQNFRANEIEERKRFANELKKELN